MKLTVRVLGVTVLTIERADDPEPESPGPDRRDCTTSPVGFTPQPRDQRWERPIHEEAS